MVHHTIPWCTMVPPCSWSYQDLPWFTTVYHGNTMVNHSKLWYDRNVLRHGRTMVYHGMVHHHGKPWYTMVYHAYTTV